MHEYVEDWRFDRSQIDELTILQQATSGLVYLHKLGIGTVCECTVSCQFHILFTFGFIL